MKVVSGQVRFVRSPDPPVIHVMFCLQGLGGGRRGLGVGWRRETDRQTDRQTDR